MAETLKHKIVLKFLESLNLGEDERRSVLELQKTRGISLDQALIEKGVITEQDLLMLLVKELRIPFINLKKYKIAPELKSVIPEKVARQYRIVPLSVVENTVTVAISDPLNVFTIDDIRQITGKDIDIVMSADSDIMHTIDNFYGSQLASVMPARTSTWKPRDHLRTGDAAGRCQADDAEQALYYSPREPHHSGSDQAAGFGYSYRADGGHGAGALPDRRNFCRKSRTSRRKIRMRFWCVLRSSPGSISQPRGRRRMGVLNGLGPEGGRLPRFAVADDLRPEGGFENFG